MSIIKEQVDDLVNQICERIIVLKPLRRNNMIKPKKSKPKKSETRVKAKSKSKSKRTKKLDKFTKAPITATTSAVDSAEGIYICDSIRELLEQHFTLKELLEQHFLDYNEGRRSGASPETLNALIPGGPSKLHCSKNRNQAKPKKPVSFPFKDVFIPIDLQSKEEPTGVNYAAEKFSEVCRLGFNDPEVKKYIYDTHLTIDSFMDFLQDTHDKITKTEKTKKTTKKAKTTKHKK
jgi:hypothetical protein